ncbi:hypothetical protein JAO29_15550 [Edaphobacter sp. HDX4]|uniref:P-loop NTPase fold protein n=1 Tax=Edaphobacter sp. HDX4 TaxID=2794064 RepID=UPI003AC03DE7
MFLDDLDRCRPEQVVQILEAINFLSSDSSCFIIVAPTTRRSKPSPLSSSSPLPFRSLKTIMRATRRNAPSQTRWPSGSNTPVATSARSSTSASISAAHRPATTSNFSGVSHKRSVAFGVLFNASCSSSLCLPQPRATGR